MAVLGYDKLITLRDQLFEEGTYDLESFQPASYELRVGNKELLVEGEYYPETNKGVIELPPHQISFVSTVEVLRLPHDVRGEIGLRLEYAAKGLVKLFGEQVDPLYHGRLYLPVFNLSDRPVVIKPGDRVAIIVFQEVRYRQKNRDVLLEELGRFRKSFKSIPRDVIEDWQGRHMVEIYERIDEYSESIRSLKQQIDSVTATSQYVIWGGIFVIAMTVLGVVLETVFGTWNSALSIASALQGLVEPYSTITLLLVPVITVVLFMCFVAVILGRIAKHLRN